MVVFECFSGWNVSCEVKSQHIISSVTDYISRQGLRLTPDYMVRSSQIQHTSHHNILSTNKADCVLLDDKRVTGDVRGGPRPPTRHQTASYDYGASQLSLFADVAAQVEVQGSPQPGPESQELQLQGQSEPGPGLRGAQ